MLDSGTSGALRDCHGDTVSGWFIGRDEGAGDVEFVGPNFLRRVETGEDTLGRGGGDGSPGYCVDEGLGKVEGGLR